jgi:hypothetical protein
VETGRGNMKGKVKPSMKHWFKQARSVNAPINHSILLQNAIDLMND